MQIQLYYCASAIVHPLPVEYYQKLFVSFLYYGTVKVFSDLQVYTFHRYFSMRSTFSR